jgi:F-box domain
MQDSKIHMACWSDLSNDALQHIMGFLSLPDHHRFSAVCRIWQQVAKKKTLLSCLAAPMVDGG